MSKDISEKRPSKSKDSMPESKSSPEKSTEIFGPYEYQLASGAVVTYQLEIGENSAKFQDCGILDNSKAKNAGYILHNMDLIPCLALINLETGREKILPDTELYRNILKHITPEQINGIIQICSRYRLLWRGRSK